MIYNTLNVRHVSISTLMESNLHILTQHQKHYITQRVAYKIAQSIMQNMHPDTCQSIGLKFGSQLQIFQEFQFEPG
ncbi:MAG: hypothetical protein CO119_02055 [Flavobacteriales bacterium CG_4_9_14_3_um_filter_40_17]|nr:MAG: hypothetical protein CO119_02055 [Flavobacteriales bacterium CG_4_9_14_3_um_filter_40_17]